MKILFVHEFYGAMAGAEQNILATARALKKNGDELSFLYGKKTGNDEQLFDDAFQGKYRASFGARLKKEEKAKEVFGVIREASPDIVYVHRLADMDILEALTRAGRPLVRMTHDHDMYCLRSYRYNYFTRRPCRRKSGFCCYFPCLAFIVRNRSAALSPVKFASLGAKLAEIELCKKFDRVFAVTRYMKEELLIQGFDEKKILIFPPIPGEAGSPDARDISGRASSSVSRDKNLIVYAGQVIRGKGVDVFIRAMSFMKNDFRAVIVGAGNHLAYCRDLAKRSGLDGKIEFTGWVEPIKVRAYYEKAALVALPSVWPEPIATIGLEAMQHGLPVVAFDSGGISDWLTDGENGFLVPWMDARAFAAAMDRLLSDNVLARAMGEKAKIKFHKLYDFPAYIRGIRSVFSELV